MSWHIIALYGPGDAYQPRTQPDDEILVVPFGIPGHPQAVHHTLDADFQREGIAPSGDAMDILRVAIAAYSADVRVPRRVGFDGWTRDFTLHFAVEEPAQWAAAGQTLARLLAYLTGDHWTIVTRGLPAEWGGTGSAAAPETAVDRQGAEIGQVCLFSGGLDSYIGAVDVVERTGRTLLVGHHGSGQGATSIAQRNALAAFRQHYAPERAPFVRLWVSPPKKVAGVSETTTRSRSILFLALGLAAASGVGAKQFIVPENGFISLNVPLTPSRLGSLSTRTTHPHLIALLRQLLRELGVQIDVVLPYRFRTKGEMITACANQEALEVGLAETMSCAHPGAGRYFGQKKAFQHCGYCLPCLVRRASIKAARGNDPTEYAVTDLTTLVAAGRGADIRACRLALERYAARPPRLTDLLRAGPLRGTQEELRAYLQVFERGLSELRGLLNEGMDSASRRDAKS